MYWITAVLGLAMGIAPYVLGYSDNTNAFWTSIVLGAVVLIVSLYEAIDEEKARWEYVVAALAGLLAVIAPFALGFTALTSALWATIVLGAVIVILSGYELVFADQMAR